MKSCASILLILFLSLPHTVGAQPPVAIKGIVTDAKENRLNGCNVVIKGTQNGTTTDSCGEFLLQVEGEEPVLIFSYIGSQVYEVVLKTAEITDGTPLVFQLSQLGKITNKACKKKIDRKLRKYRV